MGRKGRRGTMQPLTEHTESAEREDLPDFLTPVEYSGNSTGQGGKIRQNPQSAQGGQNAIGVGPRGAVAQIPFCLF